MIILTIKFSGLKQFYENQKFFFPDELLYNLYTSLKTKPFVILSGISGTGKSKIIDLFASYYAKELSYENNYELVPVKPNWTDNRAVFGYHNIIDNTYAITPVIKLFLRALKNPNKPYFLVLDEMNLARVEYYFSDFLSLIESRKYEFKEIVNREIDVERFIVEFKGKISLSEAIILSALQLKSDNFESIETYRNMPISQWWLQNSTSDNPEAQFRSELNQNRGKGIQPNGYRNDGGRLAGRAFWAEVQGDSYKLKKPEEMDKKTRADFNSIKDIYDRFAADMNVNNKLVSVKQDKISLHSSNEPLKTQQNQSNFSGSLYSEKEGYYVPSEIEIPLNIFVIGTVNIDETTHMFSPKVLDRSNVIEFNDVDLYNAFGYGTAQRIDNLIQPNLTLMEDKLNLKITLPTKDKTIWFYKKHPEEFKILVDIFEALESNNMHFGYRVFNEISLYIENYITKLPSNLNQALDNQILQKVLPKLNGGVEELEEVLLKLREVIPENRLPRSNKKVEEMIVVLETTGHVTFIR